jgi:enoyl-[acyl-carrier protein] reductase II
MIKTGREDTAMDTIKEMLKCKYPIIQGAMGVICNPELVAAVSNAGGFGLLATAFSRDSEIIRNQIRETKKFTDKPFGLNLFTMNPLIQEFVDILAEEGIGTVTISGGSPKKIIPYVHSRGIKAIVVVPTVGLARKAELSGADAVVAEGSESGGMQGYNGASTMVLVPAICDTVNIPVIAAGGIGDSRGYRAAMALGAQGVQIGTRFITATECIAHINYKKTITELRDTGTRLVDAGRFRIRALHTPLVEKILADPMDIDAHFNIQAVEKSWIRGDINSGILPAGEVSGLISDIVTAKQIIDEMVGGS